MAAARDQVQTHIDTALANGAISADQHAKLSAAGMTWQQWLAFIAQLLAGLGNMPLPTK
jgi:hypothetical protein